MKLKKRSWGVSAYEAVIDGVSVPFDVRFLGDNYYDKLWQYKMLQNKIFNDKNVPRMSDEDYFYSLIYHSKLQKKVKEEYKSRLQELALKLNIENYVEDSIDNDLYIAKILSNYMTFNKYSFAHPIDACVPINKKFFFLLDDFVRKGFSFKPALKFRISRNIPKVMFKITPTVLKNTLKKVLLWK